MVYLSGYRALSKLRRGYVLFALAASMVAVCGFAGLATDVGYAELTRRQAQAAADAGAKAAAFEIANGSSAVTSAAKQDTANNGFTDGENNVTVTVSSPPSSGTYASMNNYAEVTVTRVINTGFMSVLGQRTMTISARAVGASMATSGGGCIYVLDPTASGALTVSGSGSLRSGCGVVVNSSNTKAMVTSGSACVTASVINITGNYNSSSSCPLSPLPTTGVAASPDPLANIVAPTTGACAFTNYKPPSGSTLNPGVYCGGITVSGGGTVNFNAGTYVLLGGGLTVSGGSSIAGQGVTFYNTANSTYSYKPIVVSGGSSTNLAAPTSGLLEGILFFQDRSISSSSQNTVSGASGAKFAGALYFPTTPLVYSGGSNTSGSPYTIIVADTLTISGPSYIGNDYSSLSSGSPVKGPSTAVLAE